MPCAIDLLAILVVVAPCRDIGVVIAVGNCVFARFSSGITSTSRFHWGLSEFDCKCCWVSIVLFKVWDWGPNSCSVR